MTGSQLTWAIIKALVIFGFVLNVGALLTWFDRRGGALMQDRPGPNRAVLKIGKLELRLAGAGQEDGVETRQVAVFVPGVVGGDAQVVPQAVERVLVAVAARESDDGHPHGSTSIV